MKMFSYRPRPASWRVLAPREARETHVFRTRSDDLTKDLTKGQLTRADQMTRKHEVGIKTRQCMAGSARNKRRLGIQHFSCWPCNVAARPFLRNYLAGDHSCDENLRTSCWLATVPLPWLFSPKSAGVLNWLMKLGADVDCWLYFPVFTDDCVRKQLSYVCDDIS